ncbi:MAG: hypothetical protein CL878_15415 [Dehalococcoidia bacterium]|nr:hypothetical protein [Dehalococcoidia bacterium]
MIEFPRHGAQYGADELLSCEPECLRVSGEHAIHFLGDLDLQSWHGNLRALSMARQVALRETFLGKRGKV